MALAYVFVPLDFKPQHRAVIRCNTHHGTVERNRMRQQSFDLLAAVIAEVEVTWWGGPCHELQPSDRARRRVAYRPDNCVRVVLLRGACLEGLKGLAGGTLDAPSDDTPCASLIPSPRSLLLLAVF